MVFLKGEMKLVIFVPEPSQRAPSMPKLRHIKSEIFAQYVADGVHHVKAYELSGHCSSPNLAGRMASRPQIRERIAEIVSKRAYRSGEISQTRIMTELARIGFSDIRKVAQWVTREEVVPITTKGNQSGPERMATKRVTELMIFDSDKIDDDTAAAIQSITRGRDGSLQIKFYDKHAALMDMGKQLGMFTDKLEVGQAGDFAKLNDEELERFIRAKVINLEATKELSQPEGSGEDSGQSKAEN